MKIAFIDRDGTIVKDYPDEEWRGRIHPKILDGSINGLQYLQKQGYRIIIITNQYIIGEGYITIKDYEHFTQELLNELKSNDIHIPDIFYCPHARKQNCSCCKPSPGLILQAARKYPIDWKRSILIGDSVADKEIAQYFDLPFYGIRLDCEHVLNDLSEIKRFI